MIDMLSIGDSLTTLDFLLKGALYYVKINAQAVSMTVKGFPMKVDVVLRRHFKREVQLRRNPFLYAAQDDESLNKVVEKSLSEGWFGCPYDGDAVL